MTVDQMLIRIAGVWSDRHRDQRLHRIGLFQAETSGRLFIRNVQGDISWTSYFDWPAPADQPAPASADRVNDWFAAISRHTILRRAAADAHLALSNPHEAVVFAYRGLEWLVVGRNISWDELAAEIGAPAASLRDLKKMANVDFGLRHATSTGIKARANLGTSGSAVALLFDAINAKHEAIGVYKGRRATFNNALAAVNQILDLAEALV